MAPFPTIAHLHGSRGDASDQWVGESLTREILHSRVVVLEKLDGLNVGLDFSASRRLRFFSRALGEVRPRQMARPLWPLVDWAYLHLVELWSLLGTKRRLFGEWLGLPGALPYPRRPDDFVALGLRERDRFVAFARARAELSRHGFAVPPELTRAVPRTTEHLEKLSRRSVWGGRAEGVVLEHAGRWFKFVRADFEQGVGALSPSGKNKSEPTPSRRGHRATVTKRFPPERAANGELELAILKRGVGARVLKVERSSRGLKLELEHVGTGRWPKKPSAELVSSLGRELRKLNRIEGMVAARLAPGPTAHALPMSRRLAALLAPQETALARSSPVLCHGDLKPSNVRVEKQRARLIDFERALYAERAWELGAAADRLPLRREHLPELWKSAGVRTADEVARAALYRLAWTLHLTDGRPGSSSARKIAAALRDRAKKLRRF